MLETHQQLRDTASESRTVPSEMKVDNIRWKKRQATQERRLKGPCIFGCQTSGKTGALARRSERWHAVPSPSPWPGIEPGETLCMKCYAWGVSNPKARAKRQRCEAQIGPPAIRVGHQYRLHNLRSRIELNGQLVTAEYLPDDNDRVVVLMGDTAIRVHIDSLQNPAVPIRSADQDADIQHRTMVVHRAAAGEAQPIRCVL